MPGVDAPSMGVAEEFLLCDTAGRPASCGNEVVRAAEVVGLRARRLPGRARLVLTSPLCGHPRDLRRHVLAARTTTAAVARSADARLIAAGAPPAGDLAEPLVCGCHVRVSVPEGAPEVLGHLEPWLPVLLALSANSAVHRGRDTGYASWRTVLQSGFPSGARLSGRTVEVRFDVPATADETVALATLVRALVAAALRHRARGEVAPPVPGRLLHLATWRAARTGLTGSGVDPRTGRLVPQADVVGALLRHVRCDLERFGELRMTTNLVDRTLTAGNGATRQRTAFSARKSAADVLAHLERLTVRSQSSCAASSPGKTKTGNREPG